MHPRRESEAERRLELQNQIDQLRKEELARQVRKKKKEENCEMMAL